MAAAPQEDPWFDGAEPRPHTRAFIALLEASGEHGLDPAAYRVDAIAKAIARGDPPAATSALLDDALAAYARDLRVPRDPSGVVYVDAELQPAAPAGAVLRVDGSLGRRLAALHDNNPLYRDLRASLAQYRGTWGKLPQIVLPDGPPLAAGSRGTRVALLRQRLGVPQAADDPQRYDAALGKVVARFREAHGLSPRPVADRATIEALNRGAAHYESVIAANLDRLRGLPAEGRYVLVDTAAASLRLIEGGEVVDSMKVVVGKPGMDTPLMAAFIRYAIVDPYWNVPPDLVRANVAPAVIREGEGALKRRGYVLSRDWQSTARVDPAEVDWRAVAAGRASIWVRQVPGGSNMMGAVKFMLPNDLGIYLHDTPDKTLFQRTDRRLSSGCVRVEDAARLAKWLFGRPILEGDRAPDTRIDLAQPVPVFITRLTASVADGRVRFHPAATARTGRAPGV